MEYLSPQQRYIEQALPVALLYDMLCGRAQRHDWFYRSIGFSKSGHRGLIWWRDKQHQIVNYESFLRHLRAFSVEQLHLGSLYHAWGSDANAQRRLHELVLDIDLTDYRRYCACATAKEKRACQQCWLHIEGTVLVLRHLLCDVLGVPERHLLWVYSGKKGVHCLVNDPRLMPLDGEARERLRAQLSRSTAQQQREFAAQLPLEVSKQLQQLFVERCVVHRQLVQVPAFRAACLQLLKQHYPALHAPLFLAWNQPCGSHGSAEDWEALCALCALQQAPQDAVPATLLIALQCYYPVIDGGPLKLDHLYKMPFSVHADTGRLALPMRGEQLVADNALPLGTLDRASLLCYCEQNAGALPPAFVEARDLFAHWLEQYAL